MPKRLVCPDSGKRMTAHLCTVSVCCACCGEFVRLTKDRRMMRHAPGPGAAARQAKAISAIKEWKEDHRET